MYSLTWWTAICDNKVAGDYYTCSNRGFCIGPELCQCFAHYEGRYCENYVQKKVGAGHVHSILVTYGQVFTFGYNYYGQLGIGSYTDSNIPKHVSIQSVDPYVTYVTGGGFAWSSYGYFYGFTLAVLLDGNCAAWGYNYYGIFTFSRITYVIRSIRRWNRNNSK